ncbi:oxidoreductase [Prosthecomicrobium hirschii]|uniref:Gfo/Idh/MocA family protein n=1 Tax=Prosthecodimorpha hirschii TaxID=665126 RepID=UPI0011291A81|nr:Gfo/Idh/MocA family oxidoreductase [Prosthecomicrobium hirschii]TPQ49161.1 oxidoreductase [Prosthecomicrobium hirschii]
MTAHPSGRPPVRILVAGAGLIGRAHIGRILADPDTGLAGIADPSAGARDHAAALGVPWFETLEQGLDGARPDGVILATPNQLHVAGGLAAIAAGVPVLVEKPIAETVAGAVELAEATERAGVPVLVGHHRRHSPIAARARAIVASGQLGRIVAVNGLSWLRKPDSGYFDGAGTWRREPGGGPILINLVHVVDDLRALCGDIVAVQAVASNATRGFAVEDTAAVLFTFASGALGTLALSDTAVGPWSWELTSGENKAYPATGEACYLIAGTEAALSVPRLELWRHEGAPHWFHPIAATRLVAPEADPLVLQLKHFTAVVRGEDKPLVDARSAARTLAATLAVSAAAASSGTVRPEL